MNEDRTSIRRLGRDTMIYGVGVVLSRAVSFFMLPVYTRFLTPSDYGVLQLLDMTVDIASILFVAGMTAGMGLFYYQSESDAQRGRIVRTAFALEVTLALVAGVTIMVAAPLIWRHGLQGAGSPFLVRLAGANFAMQALASAPLGLLQLRQLSHRVVAISLGKLVGQLSLNIVFIVIFRYGVAGILFSSLIVNTVMGLGLSVWLIHTTDGHPSWEVVRRLRRFGFPYQLSAAGAFILAFGDRFFLQASHGAAAVGLYGLAYQFGFLLYQLSASPLLSAWNPQRLQMLTAPSHIRDARNARGFFYFNLILVTVATGIGVFVRPVIGIMTTAPFHSAAFLVPIILAAYVVGAWMDGVKFGIDVSERTMYFTYANWIGVAVIMVLYALLIPPLGGIGAAVATFVAFTVRFGLVYHWAQRLSPMQYDWPPVLRLVAIGAAAVGTATAAPLTDTVSLSAVGAALIALYSLLVWGLVLQSDDRRLLRRYAFAPREALALFRK